MVGRVAHADLPCEQWVLLVALQETPFGRDLIVQHPNHKPAGRLGYEHQIPSLQLPHPPRPYHVVELDQSETSIGRVERRSPMKWEGVGLGRYGFDQHDDDVLRHLGGGHAETKEGFSRVQHSPISNCEPPDGTVVVQAIDTIAH